MEGIDVLIVEDDPSLRQLLEIALKHEQRVKSIHSTEGADHALAIAEEITPDVVIVDSVLKADGSEVGSLLREILPDARLISFSGLERAAPWADDHVLKSGDSVSELMDKLIPERIPEDDDAVGTMLHDLRNPIGAISGFANILSTRRDRLSSEQLDQVLDSLQRTAARLSGMVDDFAQRFRQS